MKLLNQLYCIHSMSGQENAMRKFIKNYVRTNIPGAEVTQDHGNLYIVKGRAESYPCVVAHTDQVQTKHSKDFKVFLYDDVLFAYSAENGRQEGLGADDKNGIWVALKCLERFDAMKVALFKEEEIGCGGSSIANLDFFSDCRYILQVDRRNGGDLITDICGSICSNEFIEDITPIAERHGYKETSGMMTDVEELSDRGVGLSCINMSCGYYEPHTDSEYTKVSELKNCAEFVFDIIENMTGVYPHERKKQTFYGYGGYSRVGAYYSRLWDDDLEVADYNASFGVDDQECEPFIPDFKDYAHPIDAVYAFLDYNLFQGFDVYDLWAYIQADCETYGISFHEYEDIAWDVYSELEDNYGEEVRCS